MIRVTILLVFAWCAARFLRNRPAAERHLLWTATLGTAFVLPLLALVIPAWRPGVAARIAAALPSLPQPGVLLQAPRGGGAIIHAAGIESASEIGLALFAIWVVGVFATTLLFLPGIKTVRRLAARSHPLTDPEWE